MSAWFAVGAALGACVTLLHAWGGEWKVLRPLRRGNQVAPFSSSVLEVVWHLVTCQLAATTGALVFLTWRPQGAVAHALALVVLAQALAAMTSFLGFSRLRSGRWGKLPQAWLFVGLAFFTVGGIMTATSSLPLLPGAAGMVAACSVAAVMLGLAGLHLSWVLGSTWPARNGQGLALLVVGTTAGSRAMPSRALTVVVALALMGGAAWVLGATGAATALGSSWAGAQAVSRVGGWAVAFLFAVRGLGGFFEKFFRSSVRGTPYAVWNERLYSPLCLVLSALLAGALPP
jgi:hypothetical protein